MTTFTTAPWNGDAGQWDSADAYAKACLIDENPPGKPKTKALCKLPYQDPKTGAVNVNALHAAVAALAGGRGGVQATPASKKAAARKILAFYRERKEPPPPSLMRIAGA